METSENETKDKQMAHVHANHPGKKPQGFRALFLRPTLILGALMALVWVISSFPPPL